MKKYDFINKEFLIKEYIKNEKSMKKIAKPIGCHYSTIRDKLIKFGIKIRTKSEANKGLIPFSKGKHLSKKHRENIGKANKGVSRCKGSKNRNYIDNRTNKKYYCIESNCNNKISYCNWKYGNRRCNFCAAKKCWEGREYQEKTRKNSLKAVSASPNKLEKRLNKLLQKILPNEYKFVGNGQVIIDKLCPDFVNINNQKKIIELYGDYWHNLLQRKRTDKRRIKTYNRYGYKTLIVWKKELKNIAKLKIKILEF